MEAGEYRLARGRCFLECRFEFDDVAGYCVLRGLFWVGASFPCFFFPNFFFLRTRTAGCTYEATSGLLNLSASNEARPRERSDRGFFLTWDLWTRESIGYRVGRVFSHAVSSSTRSPGCCGFRGVFRVGRTSPCFFFDILFLRTHTSRCKYEATSCLINLSTSDETVFCL